MIILRKPLKGLSERSLARFTSNARAAAGLCREVNVVLTTSREVRDLNRCFRGKDEPTDVLSFPAIANHNRDFCGDIVISTNIARQNARRLGHLFADEIRILILHGLLHLAGHDHENDHGEMSREEARLRRRFRLPVGLIERTTISPGPARSGWGRVSDPSSPGQRPGPTPSRRRKR